MSRPRWTLTIHVGSAVVGTTGWRAKEELEQAGFRPIWLGTTREWTLDRRHAADVVAAMETTGAAIILIGENISPEVADQRDRQRDDSQLALDVFGGAE